MGFRVIAGSLAKSYRTTVKDLEVRLTVIEILLVLPLLVRAVLYLRQRAVRSVAAKWLGKSYPEGLKFFVDAKDVFERAFWAGFFAAASALLLGAGLNAVWGAAIASALSVLKNYVKQRREIAAGWEGAEDADRA